MSVHVGQMKYKAFVLKHAQATNEYGEITESNEQTRAFYCNLIQQDTLIDKGAGRFEYSTHELTAIVKDYIVNSGDLLEIDGKKFRALTVKYTAKDNVFYILEAKLELIK